MRDLRKKILLESGKTVSRKARSRPESGLQSPADSPVPSRGGSRITSRYASEEEEPSDSDYDESVASSILNSEDGEDGAVVQAWPDRLEDRITSLLDRKRSSGAARESSLTAYTHLMRHHYAEAEIAKHLGELIPTMLKSLRNGGTTEETVLALKALQVTIISMQSDSIYHIVFSALKTACQDSDEEEIKVEALIAMTVATMCGGGSIDDADELLRFLVEIVESDGHSIEAGDNGPVVSAALTCWGFTATHLDDLQSAAEEAIDAFIEQLDSTDVDVQIVAGTNVALICESLREYEEETGEVWNLDYNKTQLIERMRTLTKESSKSISKKHRRQLHASFNSVLTSLERGKGPGYSTALDDDFKEFGYREKLRIQNISLVIDSWSLSVRIEMLKHVIGGGLATHYMENPAVKDLLSDAQAELVSGPKPTKKNDSSHKKNRGSKGLRNSMGL